MLTLFERMEESGNQNYKDCKITILEEIKKIYEIYLTDSVPDGGSSISDPKLHLVEIMDSISRHKALAPRTISACLEKHLPTTANLAMLSVFIIMFV